MTAIAPNEPTARTRDWRYWVGGVGRVLLVFGLLVFGFLAYQLWGTGIEYNQSQDALGREFEQRQESLATDPSVTADANTPPITEEFPTTSLRNTTASSTGGSSVAPESPTTDTQTATSAPGSTAGRKRIWPSLAKGDAMAIIEIPAIRKRVYALAGVAPNDLKRGLGHYPGTPLPGQFGNASFAGHRTTYGAPLLNIDKLRPGDEIIVSTLLRDRYVYVVAESPRVISSFDTSVIATTDQTVATLTLTSCHPKYSAKERIYVTAVLDASRSGKVEEATPEIDPPAASDRPELVDEDNPVEPGVSDPASITTLATDGETGSVAPDSQVGSTVAPSETVGSNNGSAIDDNYIPGGVPEELSGGWFADSAAWWDVALWTAVELLVVAAGWLLSRRYQRRWLGYVVGAAPFLVVLYFVYQNVNRLLPAGI